MNTVALDLSFEIAEEALFQKLRLKEKSPYRDRVRELITEARAIAKPKGVYKDSYVESKEKDFVIIDGIRFKSHILQINLENVHRVFPFVITCGRELEDWSKGIPDLFENFCADTIKEMILHSATESFKAKLDEQFGLSSASDMFPGSLPDWPISEQKPLLKLLGEVNSLIGVELTESFLLLPMKSVSGIRFPTEGSFVSCQLCPRGKCPNRKVPYEPGLHERYQ